MRDMRRREVDWNIRNSVQSHGEPSFPLELGFRVKYYR